MIVELRSTSLQTVAPGSHHDVTGELIRWDEDGEPTAIDPAALMPVLEAMAEAVRRDLGELPAWSPRPAQALPHRPLVGGGSAYGSEALRREAETVAATPEGGRNDALNRAAFKLGTLIGGGELDRAGVEAELTAAARHCGLPESESRRTIASGIEDGIKEPRQRPNQSVGRSGQPPTSPPCTATDSIHAPQGWGRAQIEFRPVPITELGPAKPPSWIWPGYIARGHITLFSGLWKAGKSTMIAHLLRDIERGGGLAGEAQPVEALVVTEESSTIWTLRRDQLGLGSGIYIAARPFLTRPSSEDWQALIGRVVDHVRSTGCRIVVFDTLAALWPVQNENDAADVGAALMPMHAITEAGAAVLMVHHLRKGDGTEAQAARGSGALTSAVDIIIELRRYNPEESTDRRRILRAYGRFDDVPPEAVLELREGEYVGLGDKAQANREDRARTILSLLPASPPGLTAEDVRENWPAEPKPGKRAVELALADGAQNGRWASAGRGVKGDPRRFWRTVGFDSRTAPPRDAQTDPGPPLGPVPPPSADEWGEVA